MSTRNRSSYSNQKSGRAGGGTAVKQAGAILMLGVLSFVLGFFVLSRFVPAGHGPDSPTTASPNDGGNGEPGPDRTPAAAAPVRRERTVPTPARQSAATPGPTIDPAPSIDPADDGPTQKPASIDDSADEKKSSDGGRQAAREHRSASDLTQDNAPENGAASAPNESSPPAPPAHRRHRRRRAAKNPENRAEGQTANPDATQRPASLDDSGNQDAGGNKGDQGGDGDGNHGNN